MISAELFRLRRRQFRSLPVTVGINQLAKLADAVQRAGMNARPPNPGYTLITQTTDMGQRRRQRGDGRVGLMATPGSMPSDRIWCEVFQQIRAGFDMNG